MHTARAERADGFYLRTQNKVKQFSRSQPSRETGHVAPGRKQSSRRMSDSVAAHKEGVEDEQTKPKWRTA